MGKKRLFNLNDPVVLGTGQKGIVFRLPECAIVPEERSCGYDEDPIYGVLYVDDKGFHFGPYDVNESGMSIAWENRKEEPKHISYGIIPIHRIERLTCPHCSNQLKVAYYDYPENRTYFIEFVSHMRQKIENNETLYLRDTSYIHPFMGRLELIRVLTWDGHAYICLNNNNNFDNIKYKKEWLHMLLTCDSELSSVYQLIDIYAIDRKGEEKWEK